VIAKPAQLTDGPLRQALAGLPADLLILEYFCVVAAIREEALQEALKIPQVSKDSPETVVVERLFTTRPVAGSRKALY
jgi:hypothetical protein